MRRRGLLILLLAVALGACGDDDGPEPGSLEAFCADVERADELFEDVEIETMDDARRARDAMSEIEAPAELEADLETVIEGFDLLLEAVDGAGGDPEDLTPEQLEALRDPLTEAEEATRRLEDFQDERC